MSVNSISIFVLIVCVFVYLFVCLFVCLLVCLFMYKQTNLGHPTMSSISYQLIASGSLSCCLTNELVAFTLVLKKNMVVTLHITNGNCGKCF